MSVISFAICNHVSGCICFLKPVFLGDFPVYYTPNVSGFFIGCIWFKIASARKELFEFKGLGTRLNRER